MNLGDRHLGDTIDFKFSTNSTAGAPTTLAGTPSLKVYRSNSTTEITAGITLTVDFDSVTGMHHARIVASEANGYAWGDECDVVVHAGTVGGQSIAGTRLAHFTIEKLRLGVIFAKAADGGDTYVDVPTGTKVGVGDEAVTLPNGATAEGVSQKVKSISVGTGTGGGDRITMHGKWTGTNPASGTYVAFTKRDGMSYVIPATAPGQPTVLSVSSDYEDGVAMVGDGSVGNRRRRTGQAADAP